jgi:hypothetical protein
MTKQRECQAADISDANPPLWFVCCSTTVHPKGQQGMYDAKHEKRRIDYVFADAVKAGRRTSETMGTA